MPWHLISPTTCKDFQVNISNELSSSSAAAQSIFSIIVPPWHTHEPWAPSRQWVAERNRVERERERESSSRTCAQHHQQYFTWFNFCLSQRICCNLHSPRLPSSFSSGFFFFILMNYYALHNFRQLMTLSSARFIHLPLPFSPCVLSCVLGGKREKREESFGLSPVSWPGRSFASLYLCMPNLWKFDVLVSYFGGILLYLFAHNRNTCPTQAELSPVDARCWRLFSRSDRASKLAPK